MPIHKTHHLSKTFTTAQGSVWPRVDPEAGILSLYLKNVSYFKTVDLLLKGSQEELDFIGKEVLAALQWDTVLASVLEVPGAVNFKFLTFSVTKIIF